MPRVQVQVVRRNSVYVGMLALSCLSMLIGVLLLAFELNSYYDFQTAAKGGPAISLPKDTPRTPASAGAPKS